MIPIHIDRLAYGGYGVGRVEGKVYFVPYGLPGDVLEVAVFRDQNRYAYASIEKIITPSPDRIQAPCSYFGNCGGCNWQHLPYEKQLFWKMAILKETLERIGRINTEVLPIIPSPKQFNYRNRIQLHVNRAGEIGFYKTHGQEIVSIDQCLIAEDAINGALENMDPRKIRQLGWDVEFIYNHEKDEVHAEGGKGVFSQVNSEQNKALIKTVLQFLDGSKKILELFAGSGNFSFPLAAQGATVTAIEQSPPTKIQTLGEIPRGSVHFITGKVERVLKKMLTEKKTFDAVLMDPPRKGASLALKSVVTLGPQKIVYVSCFPPTLARDLKFFVDNGYRLEALQPVDMFPQTYHIESVAYLKKDAI